jgi:hypothetical protein
MDLWMSRNCQWIHPCMLHRMSTSRRATSGCCTSSLFFFFFFEEVKASAGVRSLNNNNNSGDASRSTTIAENCRALKKQMSQMRIKGDELRKNGKLAKKNSRNSRSGMQLLPSRSRRIFDRLWAVGKGHGDSRSSDTPWEFSEPNFIGSWRHQILSFSFKTREAFHLLEWNLGIHLDRSKQVKEISESVKSGRFLL